MSCIKSKNYIYKGLLTKTIMLTLSISWKNCQFSSLFTQNVNVNPVHLVKIVNFKSEDEEDTELHIAE